MTLTHKQHEPVVSSQVWLAAQTILNICRYSGKAALPVLRVIDKGALDCTLRARVECAVFRACRIEKDFPWGGVIR